MSVLRAARAWRDLCASVVPTRPGICDRTDYPHRTTSCIAHVIVYIVAVIWSPEFEFEPNIRAGSSSRNVPVSHGPERGDNG